jgi:hypothetical protein
LHLLVVTGLSGEPSFAASFNTTAGAIHDAARNQWGVPAASLIWLAEDTTVDRTRINGRATRDGVRASLTRLLERSRPGDVITLLLIGHGSGESSDSRIALTGPDATAADIAGWLAPIKDRTLVIIVAASGSGDFLPVLAAPGRVVVTATKSAVERNESLFGARFAHGLASAEADADKDRRVSVLEAFLYAKREVAAAYAADGRLMTEHAIFDDNGDGIGVADPGTASGADGSLARRVSFGRSMGPVSPAVAALLAERRGLETEVEALRRRKDSMPEAAYLSELERLMVAIAQRTRSIRAATGTAP